LKIEVEIILGKQAVKKTILLIVVSILSIAGAARAEKGDLGVSFDLQYRSKWLSKGAQVYGQQGAFFETIDLDLYGTGLGMKVTHRSATASGYVDKQRFDYRPYYMNELFEGEPFATKYDVSAGYEHYPGLARHRSYTTWEWRFAFAWPNIMPEGFVPRYIAHYEYAAGSNYTKHNGADIPSGWVHRFILGYDLETSQLPEPISLSPEPIHLSSAVAYTDGLGGAAHDWSYATFGISTKFNITDNLAFVPGIYHQVSMDDSVNTRKDLTYCSIHVKSKY
jgi:hypothetical protein